MVMKTIEISNATFGLLWSRALETDSSEEDILRRILSPSQNVVGDSITMSANGHGDGYFDARYGVRFPEGFVITRTYKGASHAARVVGGKWQLDGEAKLYDSLSALNHEIGAATENAWYSWRFWDEAQRKYRYIGELRPPEMVRTRKKDKAAESSPAA